MTCEVERHARLSDGEIRYCELLQVRGQNRIANVQQMSRRIGKDSEHALQHEKERAACPRLWRAAHRIGDRRSRAISGDSAVELRKAIEVRDRGSVLRGADNRER